MKLRLLSLALLTLSACSSSSSEPTAKTDQPSPYEQSGPYPVGHAIFTVHDGARDRSLLVQLWYPAQEGARAAAEAGTPVENFIPEGADRASFEELLKTAPENCTSRVAHSVEGAEPAMSAPVPLVAFSHCSSCLRFSSFSIAERLASHGIAVIAPDHSGNTLFDALAGAKVPLNDEWLTTRADDVRFVLDEALNKDAAAIPAALRGKFDPERIGVMGHSFGAVTTGRVLQDDPRPKAGFAIAAPVANPLFSSVSIEKLHKPFFSLLAREDNSITEIGNDFIRENYENAQGEAILAEVSDAGHWSFSNICAIDKSFRPGCGEGKRQTSPGEIFTYVDTDVARDIASSYAAAYFASTLLGDSRASDYLGAAHPAELVELKRKP